MLLLIPYLIYVTFYFLITCQCCQENQAPGVALRLVTEKEYTPYLLLLQYVSLQNTDWPFNGSGYQRTHKPDGLLEAACLSFEWHQ